jgi:hypothetical protein
LLYYYAFMNLAKAALELRGLSYDRHHGLTRDEPKTDDLNKLVVDIRPRGVFPTLYECEFGVPWPKDLRPTIARLLSYATDIGFQYQRTGLGTGVWSIAPCKLRSIANEQTHECWLEIALRREFNVSAAPSTFSRRFEEVRLSNALARTRYEIPAEAMRSFRFFQTAVLPFPGQVPVADLRALVDDALGSMMEPLYVGEELDMMLACPYMDGTLSTPMNEVVAIYLVMFYLGSLVRYLPDYLDDLLGTRNAYVLESFVTSVPHTALRALVARAAGEFFLFNR